MSKTITIIQLLNKIANGEEFPKKVKFEDKIYTYYNEMTDYKNEDYFLFDMISDGCVKDFLNDKVEIIEEQEEIDIQELEEIKEMEIFRKVDTRQTFEENLKKIDKHEVNFFFKINEIIRKQNKIVQYLEQLDKNIKEK